MATATKKRSAGLTLSYRKTLDVLTVALQRQFPAHYAISKRDELARELAEELLRPALSPRERARLDAMRAREYRQGQRDAS